MLRTAQLAIGLALLVFTGANGQVVDDPMLLSQLRQVFPAAASFSPKGGTPPVFKALGPAASGKAGALLGYAYWSTELVPLERGFDGPIKMLVGIDLDAKVTGVLVTDNREPYGYFSVDLPEFAAQFKNKSVRDSFKVGDDIDAISRATISVTSASRAIRNSSRSIARTYLTPAAPAAPTAPTQ